jgi:hypothetical protein
MSAIVRKLLSKIAERKVNWPLLIVLKKMQAHDASHILLNGGCFFYRKKTIRYTALVFYGKTRAKDR